MSVANKIIVSSTLVALLAAFAGFLAWKNMRSIRGVYTTKVAAYHEISRDISRTQVHITQLISNGSEASPGELARREVRSAPAYAGLREALDRYGAWVPAGEVRDWRPAVEAYFGYLEATETAWEASVWRERSTTLVTALEALRDWEYAECQAVGEVVTGQWRRLLRSVIIVSLLTFLLAIIFGQLIARGLSQALWALQGAAQRLGEGDFSIRVDRVGEQELDKLGDTFRSLASDLEKAQIIERQNEALAHLNHQLKRKNDSLDSFAYRVSHDLKAPVVNLQSFLGILRRQLRAEQDERVEQSLFYMDQSAEKLQRTIRDLLEVSRIERSLPVEKRWVSLSEVVEELRLEHLGWMEESRAQILTDFEVAEVYFSPPNLKSILANLLTNSIKYRSPERDPIISVSSHLREQWLCLSISDNGMGIDLERYGAKLFGMFNRFHNHVEGSGVGLYIVKKLVEECGGRLEVDSEEGRGTTFRIYLPLESEHSPTKARALGIQS